MELAPGDNVLDGICLPKQIESAEWRVLIHDEFEPEFDAHAAGGVWRVAFAFDAKRAAILLIAGDKAGGNQKRFYKQLITKAVKRFGVHLAALEKGSGS